LTYVGVTANWDEPAIGQHFMVLVCKRRGADLEHWIADVQSTGPPELRAFSRNLRPDWQAVHTGFTVHLELRSSRRNTNRLKLMKRRCIAAPVSIAYPSACCWRADRCEVFEARFNRELSVGLPP
jgi:hypothetical protein